MPEDQQFRVTADAGGETLAASLRRWLPGESWKRIRSLVESRHVTVNGNLCLDPARRLQPAEIVKLHAKPMSAPPKDVDVEVIHCDADVVVVNKPTGMTSVRHPAEAKLPPKRRQKQPTLDEIIGTVVARFEGKKFKQTVERIRPVHRLDRDTSGLLVLARTVEAERLLGMQFRDHTIHRRYLAVVAGRVDARTIESNLVLNRGDGRRGSTEIPNLGQRAVTHVRPVEFLRDHTLVECRLETGRTHQIRIHLSEAGHPVAGDRVYRKPMNKAIIPDTSDAPRLALHAAELGFVHPGTGEEVRFHAALPADLDAFVRRLKK